LTFLAGVTHDLRTPLTAAMLSLAGSRADWPLPPEPRLRHVLEVVGRQTHRMVRMLDDLVDVASIEAGRLNLRLEVTDVVPLVGSVVALFQLSSPSHRLVPVLPDHPVLLDCDGVRLEQVLTNLVSNAIKYSPAGGEVEVRVAAGRGWPST